MRMHQALRVHILLSCSTHSHQLLDAVTRRCVRTAVSRSLFPSGSVLPSTVSAKGKPSLFDGFVSTMTLSDFSSTYMFIVRFMPS